jgi:hypothetical protein
MLILRIVSSILMGGMILLGQGWQPEQYFYGGGHFSPEGSCARFPNSNTTICVFERGPDPFNLDLYETRSSDGGVTWSKPV